MVGIIYKNNIEIDRGIIVGGKHYTKDYPDQSITICDEANAYYIKNERYYEHNTDIRFEEYQDGIKVYCSVEKVDKTINYGIPKWFTSSSPIPNYNVSIDETGEEEKLLLGHVK